MSTDSQPNESVNYYPIDPTSLQKGQVLSIETLEQVLHMRHPNMRWGLAVLNLAAWIARRRAMLGLPMLTMHSDHDTLVICTDAQASVYNARSGKRGLRRFHKAVVRNVAVDMSQLTADDRKEHQSRLSRQAILLTAIRKAQHTPPTLKPPGRVTPPMLRMTAVQ